MNKYCFKGVVNCQNSRDKCSSEGKVPVGRQLRESSQITASSYILNRHLWVNYSKTLALAPTWSLACKQTDCITAGMLKLLDPKLVLTGKKWNESGFRPPLCTYRLNWARRTSWGWWDDWDDTVLQTQDSKFEPWRSEAEHATSRSRRLPTLLTFTRGWGRNIFVSFKPPRPGTEPRTHET